MSFGMHRYNQKYQSIENSIFIYKTIELYDIIEVIIN